MNLNVDRKRTLSVFEPSSSPTPIKIAVMGGTGCGKSTFINLVANSNLGVSSSLASCTQDVQEVNFTLDGRSINLIDTPGFDDTDRSDVEVLKLIAGFLADQYQKNDQLHGILYFHRICDIRMGGASKRSFRLFRKLCGENTLKNVVLVTNMWDKVTTDEGEQREGELLNDDKFFKPALHGGAKTYRHHNTLQSAQEILRLISNDPQPEKMALDIQTEIIDDKKQLVITGAGQELESDLKASIRKVDKDVDELEADITEAKGRGDEQALKDLQDELSASRRKYARVQNELTNLRVGFDNDVDSEGVWKIMSREARVMLAFRRSIGAQEAPERLKFWAALGDTTRTSAALSDIFEKYPISTELYDALFQQGSPDAITPQLNRNLGAWIRECPKAVKMIETIMGRAFRRAKGRKRDWWRRVLHLS